MSFYDYIESLKTNDLLVEISNDVNLEVDISHYLRKYSTKAVLFRQVSGSDFPLIGNLLCSRNQLGLLFLGKKNYTTAFKQAINNPLSPEIVKTSSTFDNEIPVNLLKLPIPKFFDADGGRYLTSGIVFASVPNTSTPNTSIHRIMIINDKQGVIRLVPRDLYNIHKRNNENGLDTPIAIVVGYHPALALAASTPTPYGKSEVDIANAIVKGALRLVKTPVYNIHVPADVEFILEGRILANEEFDEGPFVDITGTIDNVRSQPIVEIEHIYHRKNPIFQTIIPAFDEHFILMGFPREVQIFNKISHLVPKVHGVSLTPGGSGWLHAVISIKPEKIDDAKIVGHAALEAHPSLKWVTVVNQDIDIHDCTAVQWATITRANEGDIIILKNKKGSSLDPSKNPHDGTTIKVIVDATKKEERGNKGYRRIIPF